MKTDKLLIGMIIVFLLCIYGIVNLYDKSNQEVFKSDIIHYNDNVIVTEGFYKGLKGVVIDEHAFLLGTIYTIRLYSSNEDSITSVIVELPRSILKLEIKET